MISCFHRASLSRWFAIILLAAVLLSCTRGATDVEVIPSIEKIPLENGEKLAVVVTTNIIGDVVANIGGELVDIVVLMESGQDPHGYEPTPKALASIERSHLVMLNGFDLEEGLVETVRNVAKGTVLSVSVGIDPLEIGVHEHETHEEESHEEELHAVDPHVWFNPQNVIVWSENIENVLSSADPSNADEYRQRAAEYRIQLEELQLTIQRLVERVPEFKRKLVSDHSVFGHFAAQYGFETVGTILPGTSTSAEASTRYIADLVELLRDEGVTSIFIGSTAGRGLIKTAEAVAKELGTEIHIVELLTGALTPPGTKGSTYIGYMLYNAERITDALAGNR